jgi:hypothetical protein
MQPGIQVDDIELELADVQVSHDDISFEVERMPQISKAEFHFKPY